MDAAAFAGLGLFLALASVAISILGLPKKTAKDLVIRRRATGVCLSGTLVFALWLMFALGARSVELPFSLERSAVIRAVNRASDVEMAAFHEPSHSDAHRLEEGFAPVARGGEIIEVIEERIKYLNNQKLRYCEGTRLVGRTISSVAISGDIAFVKCTEVWHLVVCSTDSKQIVRSVDYTNPQQVYELCKVDEQWLVKWSNTRYRQTTE